MTFTKVQCSLQTDYHDVSQNLNGTIISTIYNIHNVTSINFGGCITLFLPMAFPQKKSRHTT